MNTYTEKYELAKQMYLEGKSITKIGKELGLERHRLSYMLRQDGIEIVRNGSIHIYIEDIFSIIDTEEKAYWLGFLYADGSVTTCGKYEVKLSLAYKDLEHVKKFASFVLKNGNGQELVHPYTAKIKGEEYPSAKVIVTNKRIVNDLITLGCIPDKSLVLTFPNQSQVPQHLVRHFIRGYFDGDGSIYRVKNQKNNVCVSFVGTQLFLQSVINTLKTVCKNYGRQSLYQKKNQQAWQFSKTKYETNKKIYEYLYKDATIYLERKYKVFADLYGKL